MNGRSVGTKLLDGTALRRGTASAVVVAALLFLAGATARAQRATDAPYRIYDGATVLGLVPGQTLRVTVFNPTGEEATVRALYTTLLGRDVDPGVQTEEVNIPAGGFHSFDLNRDDIPLAGEPRTGRLEVRVEVELKVAGQSGGGNSYRGTTTINAGVLNIGTLQLIDSDSGKTAIALLLPAVQKVREAAARN